MNKPLGIYIHIPFCDGKCNYCDFYSIKASENHIDDYVAGLKKSIGYWGEHLKEYTADTVYFGGGTPSLLGTDRLCLLLNEIAASFNLSDNPEITVEVNPSGIDLLDFYELRRHGVNRISAGLQSSNDKELALLGRHHTASDAKRTVIAAQDAGIENISLDVMLGIPQQNARTLSDTLSFCDKLSVAHISTYMLKIEQNTEFFRNRAIYQFADDDYSAELYELVCGYLHDRSFEHYEISNFCKTGFESRHNKKYWNLSDYIGIGPSAHSLIDSKRFFYPRSVSGFLDNSIVSEGNSDAAEEYIMLSLRTSDGFDADKYNKLSGLDASEVFSKAHKYEKLGLLTIGDASIRLTEKGFLLSNTIIADLYQ